MVFTSQSPEETMAFGKRLGAGLLPGTVVALWGGLGAGKTALTRGIALGLGIRHPVSSPTFTLVHQLPGKIPLYHMDLYRLEGEDDVLSAGLEEMWYGDGVSVIEWPGQAGELLPEDRLDITIEITGEESRTLTLTARGKAFRPMEEI